MEYTKELAFAKLDVLMHIAFQDIDLDEVPPIDFCVEYIAENQPSYKANKATRLVAEKMKKQKEERVE